MTTDLEGEHNSVHSSQWRMEVALTADLRGKKPLPIFPSGLRKWHRWQSCNGRTRFSVIERRKDLALQVDQEGEDTHVRTSQRTKDMSIPPVL